MEFVLVLLLINCIAAQEVHLTSINEHSALLNLRSTLGLRSINWPIKSDPCINWTGVDCYNGRVIGINISGLKRTRIGRLNPKFSVDSLANLTSLQSFNASMFLLPGPIPDWFGSQLGSLEVLDLRSCSVSEQVPVSLGSMSKLKELYLSDNNLTGNIPATLGQLMELSVLNLSINSLSGAVPSSLSMLGNLTELDISSNILSGPIPIEFGSLSSLRLLSISRNSFTGSIPSQFGELSHLVKLDISKNLLEGPLPDNLLTSLRQLEIVVLSGNKLDGAIPDSIWSMRTLHFLDISCNNFTGPLSNFRLNSNTIFNLSNNMFYGQFLWSILENFSLVDLSNNYLEGKVNTSRRDVKLDRNCLQFAPNQRDLDDCKYFYATRGLSFNGIESQEPTQPPMPEPSQKMNKTWLYILVGVIGGLVFFMILVLLIVFVIRRTGNGLANVGPGPRTSVPQAKDPVVFSTLGESFNYQQLLSATDNFDNINLIQRGHSGDIYKGYLENGITVIVKRIDLRLIKNESYLRELELFSKVVHTRLVPFLGHSLDHEHEKLLVYKYMSLGDLSSFLFRVTSSDDENGDGLLSLDWITRLKIAIGTAEALSYLHHECNPPLVHRDVQASSILLDDKFEVRLGSLNEVRAQEGDSHQNVFTRYLRKQPPAPDPYPSGLSSSTCAHDIYCFGKVLLELVTGKIGISKTNDATAKEWLDSTLACISIYDKQLITVIADPSLILDEDLEEELWAMAIIARSCLNPKPAKRPPMKYVHKALENPLKVVRQDSLSSSKLRGNSSTRSWTYSLFDSWRHSSSESAPVPSNGYGEGASFGGSRGTRRVGSRGHSFSAKRLSNEIFPEPLEMQDL